MKVNPLFPNLKNQTTIKHDKIALCLYADEIKKIENSLGEAWMYIGLLIVTEHDKKKLLNSLTKARAEAGYFRELHFRDIIRCSARSEKTMLAKRWTEMVLSENKPRLINFSVLGLNLSNLQFQAFGQSKKEQVRNVYNRFFRAIISGCLKNNFSGYKNINVKAIFHDKNELEYDKLFDWHTIWRINIQEEKILFNAKNIHFIDSDHDVEGLFPKESHFIQLIDLILGLTSHCLDATKKKEGCNEIAKVFLPLVERLNDNRSVNNPRSRFDYFKKCSLIYFPKRKLTLDQLDDQWQRLSSGLYRNRTIILKEKLSLQLKLFHRHHK